MTLFFDIGKLEQASKGDSKKFISILENHYKQKLPKRGLGRPIVINGTSFLVNPVPLFESKVDSAFKVQYVRLAAKRDYTLYKYYGAYQLPRSYYPDLNLDAIKHNPLLNITDSEIQFLLEDKKEISNGISIW